MHLSSQERKRLQIEHAPHLSEKAKVVKLADKIANVMSIVNDPPEGWPLDRKLEYFDWAEKVVAGLRGCNKELEELFDAVVSDGRSELQQGQGR